MASKKDSSKTSTGRPRDDERVALTPLSSDETLRGLLDTDPNVREAIEERKRPAHRPRKKQQTVTTAPPKG
jgi:hypothetical protein